MNPGERVLSDVHISTAHRQLPGNSRFVSRFFFYFEKECDKIKELEVTPHHHAQEVSDPEQEVRSCRAKQIHGSVKISADTGGEDDDVEDEYIPPRKKNKSSVVQHDNYSDECPSKYILTKDCRTNIATHDSSVCQNDSATGTDHENDISDDVKDIPVDDDGDLILTRIKHCTGLRENGGSLDVRHDWTHVVTLEHNLATELPDVGTQVWQGAMIMCDFILNYPELFEKQVIVDLGAGTGLTSIIAGLFGSKIFCTDTGKEVLQLAQHNLDLNSDLFSAGKYSVRELDWDSPEGALKPGDREFSMSTQDIEEIMEANILIATDVIYDDDVTNAFFRTVLELLSKGSYKTLYIGIEKRLVFTLVNLDTESPAYSYFLECLNDLVEIKENGRQFMYSRIETDFPQFFSYCRTKELEMWKVTTIPNG